MARAQVNAAILLCLIVGAYAAPVVKVKAAAKAKVAVKGKAKAVKPDPCQLAQSKCDFKFGPLVKTFSVNPVVGNQILSKANILTKDGKPVTSASIYGCSIYGAPTAPCGGFQMLPVEVPIYLGADKFEKIVKYPILGTIQLTKTSASFVKRKCIVLRVDDFEIGGSTFVNKGAQENLYPTPRRCLIIRTV